MNNINELAKAAYENAKRKGFYDKPVSIPERMALIHSELSEALEADRKDRYVKISKELLEENSGLLSDEIFRSWYDAVVKGTFEEEMADVVIRILDLAGFEGRELNHFHKLPMPGLWRKAETVAEKLSVMHAHVSRALLSHYGYGDLPFYGFWPQLGFVLQAARNICEKKGIDLELHVKAKMRYNSFRPKMHGGKKY